MSRNNNHRPVERTTIALEPEREQSPPQNQVRDTQAPGRFKQLKRSFSQFLGLSSERSNDVPEQDGRLHIETNAIAVVDDEAFLSPQNQSHDDNEVARINARSNSAEQLPKANDGLDHIADEVRTASRGTYGTRSRGSSVFEADPREYLGGYKARFVGTPQVQTFDGTSPASKVRKTPTPSRGRSQSVRQGGALKKRSRSRSLRRNAKHILISSRGASAIDKLHAVLDQHETKENLSRPQTQLSAPQRFDNSVATRVECRGLEDDSTEVDLFGYFDKEDPRAQLKKKEAELFYESLRNVKECMDIQSLLDKKGGITTLYILKKFRENYLERLNFDGHEIGGEEAKVDFEAYKELSPLYKGKIYLYTQPEKEASIAQGGIEALEREVYKKVMVEAREFSVRPLPALIQSAISTAEDKGGDEQVAEEQKADELPSFSEERMMRVDLRQKIIQALRATAIYHGVNGVAANTSDQIRDQYEKSINKALIKVGSYCHHRYMLGTLDGCSVNDLQTFLPIVIQCIQHNKGAVLSADSKEKLTKGLLAYLDQVYTYHARQEQIAARLLVADELRDCMPDKYRLVYEHTEKSDGISLGGWKMPGGTKLPIVRWTIKQKNASGSYKDVFMLDSPDIRDVSYDFSSSEQCTMDDLIGQAVTFDDILAKTVDQPPAIEERRLLSKRTEAGDVEYDYAGYRNSRLAILSGDASTNDRVYGQPLDHVESTRFRSKRQSHFYEVNGRPFVEEFYGLLEPYDNQFQEHISTQESLSTGDCTGAQQWQEFFARCHVAYDLTKVIGISLERRKKIINEIKQNTVKVDIEKRTTENELDWSGVNHLLSEFDELAVKGLEKGIGLDDDVFEYVCAQINKLKVIKNNLQGSAFGLDENIDSSSDIHKFAKQHVKTLTEEVDSVITFYRDKMCVLMTEMGYSEKCSTVKQLMEKQQKSIDEDEGVKKQNSTNKGSKEGGNEVAKTGVEQAQVTVQEPEFARFDLAMIEDLESPSEQAFGSAIASEAISKDNPAYQALKQSMITWVQQYKFNYKAEPSIARKNYLLLGMQKACSLYRLLNNLKTAQSESQVSGALEKLRAIDELNFGVNLLGDDSQWHRYEFGINDHRHGSKSVNGGSVSLPSQSLRFATRLFGKGCCCAKTATYSRLSRFICQLPESVLPEP